MADDQKPANIVGAFIRERREALGLSQKALGQLFVPPVTTQFISNVERGVTPLPPVHVPTLTKGLFISEEDITKLLEKEYTQKLSGRLGRPGWCDTDGKPTTPDQDYEFIRQVYAAYKRADEKTQNAFCAICEGLLKISKIKSSNNEPQ